MPYPGRNNIYQATIRRMVAQELDRQEACFAAAHGADSEEALLCYLAEQARKLGHSPWPREIVGGTWLEQHFGSWQEALGRAGLPWPETPDRLTGFARYQQLLEQQKQLYRRRKAEKQQRAREKNEKASS